MIITTKFSIDDTIWFITNSLLWCTTILQVETCSTPDSTRTVYICNIKSVTDVDMPVMVPEANAFRSKDELINTLTERYYRTLEPGSS